MGLLAAAIILATQEFPDVKDTHWAKDVNGVAVSYDPSTEASQDRVDEIWDHVDNRVIRQLDMWFDLGEFPPCVSLLKVQYAYSPDDYDTMDSLGWMLENVEQLDDARGVYLGFLKAHPTNGNAAFPIGNSYYNKKNYAEAIKYLEISIKNNPGPNTYRILAKSYERLKKYNDAIRVWELQLKLGPDPAAEANIKRVKAKIAAGGGK